jgi:hypothetical protein
MTKHFKLIDGEQMNAEHPDTFRIPSEADRRSIKPGQLVKLMFAVPDPLAVDDGFVAERMWVSVTNIVSDTFTTFNGTLANEPVVLTKLNFGDQVLFQPRHIIDIQNESEFDPILDEAETAIDHVYETDRSCPVCDLDQLIAKTEQLIVRMKKTRDNLTESSAAEWDNYELVSPNDVSAR